MMQCWQRAATRDPVLAHRWAAPAGQQGRESQVSTCPLSTSSEGLVTPAIDDFEGLSVLDCFEQLSHPRQGHMDPYSNALEGLC